MNCKTCQYALWNLKARVCPECGSPFAPSEFEFSLNSVQFRCPHCAQAYYGTGERGHLVPVEFDCVKCGRHIHMDEMVLLPTAGIREEQTSVERSPWIERKGFGFVPWVKTIAWAMFQPRRLIRATPPESSVLSAIGFALLTNAAYLCLGVGSLFVVIAFMQGAFGGPFGGGMLGLPVSLITWAVAMVVIIAVWTLVAHGLLVLTGETTGGIGRTAQVICYSSAANAVLAVPCLNFYFGWAGMLWWVVCATVMAADAHKAGAGRAILAVAVPPVVTVVGVIAAFILWMMSLSASFTAMGAGTTTPSGTVVGWPPASTSTAELRPVETRAVLDALLAYGGENEGRAPDHVARLVLEGRLEAEAFMAGGSGLSPTNVTVGSYPLAALRVDTVGGSAAMGRMAAALPKETVEYRVGDFVFMCPGIDLGGGDPDLWIVVCAPDQSAPWAMRIPGAAVQVGRLGGTVTPIASTAFADALEEQNRLRAQFGLGPLMDPALVKEGEPVAGRVIGVGRCATAPFG